MRKILIEKVGRTARLELTTMCSERVNSVLQRSSKDVYHTFEYDEIFAELEEHTPLLLAVFKSCTRTSKPRSNQKAVIVMCMAILLKYRYGKMSLIQRIVSVILYAGHSGKQVNLV